MPQPNRLRALLTAFLLVMLAWFALTRYSQPWAVGRSAEPVRELLKHALESDSADLYMRADSQPVRWVLAALRNDSAAVREWADNRGPVQTSRHGDTLRVTLQRHRSTPRCSVNSFLTAAILEARDDVKVVHLTASCPLVPEEAVRGGA